MRGKISIPICAALAAVMLCGCQRQQSSAASMDYDTAMEEFQQAANEDGRKAEAYRGEGIIYLERQD